MFVYCNSSYPNYRIDKIYILQLLSIMCSVLVINEPVTLSGDAWELWNFKWKENLILDASSESMNEYQCFERRRQCLSALFTGERMSTELLRNMQYKINLDHWRKFIDQIRLTGRCPLNPDRHPHFLKLYLYRCNFHELKPWILSIKKKQNNCCIVIYISLYFILILLFPS